MPKLNRYPSFSKKQNYEDCPSFGFEFFANRIFLAQGTMHRSEYLLLMRYWVPHNLVRYICCSLNKFFHQKIWVFVSFRSWICRLEKGQKWTLSLLSVEFKSLVEIFKLKVDFLAPYHFHCQILFQSFSRSRRYCQVD